MAGICQGGDIRNLPTAGPSDGAALRCCGGSAHSGTGLPHRLGEVGRYAPSAGAGPSSRVPHRLGRSRSRRLQRGTARTGDVGLVRWIVNLERGVATHNDRRVVAVRRPAVPGGGHDGLTLCRGLRKQ